MQRIQSPFRSEVAMPSQRHPEARRVPITDNSCLLGYFKVSIFRRWFGMSPLWMRAQ